MHNKSLFICYFIFIEPKISSYINNTFKCVKYIVFNLIVLNYIIWWNWNLL